MDNQRKLDDAVRLRERMEASAYRLPDGRMAFKSEDGTHVFDQHDVELSRDTIDPDSIPDHLPTREAFKAVSQSERKLLQERVDLHAFQERLDHAHAVLDKGHVTAKDLDDLSAELESTMPSAVRQKLAGAAPDQQYGESRNRETRAACPDRPHRPT